MSRNRGCNESFRAAVDRSYEQQQQQQHRQLPVDIGDNSGFVIQDLDPVQPSPTMPVAPPINDENVPKVVRREKQPVANDGSVKKSNRNSRLLTGLSNMFKSQGGSGSSSKASLYSFLLAGSCFVIKKCHVFYFLEP